MHRCAKALLPLLFCLCLGGNAVATPRIAPAPLFTQVYQDHAGKRFFTENGHFTDFARATMDLLRQAPAHGLDPALYGIKRMELVTTTAIPTAQTAWDEAELFWMYNLWRYASDMAGIPLPAKSMDIILNSEKPLDTIRALAPDTPLYHAVQAELQKLNAAPAPKDAPAPITIGKAFLKQGGHSAAVPRLRTTLVEYGADTTLNTDTYDENLTEAVKRYQARYGMTPDGKVGGLTLALLNRTQDDLKDQLAANLYQLRKPDARNRAPHRVEVSIPRFTLTAFDNNQPVLSMAVVVGKRTRQTTDFSAKITGIRLNPTWTVPDTIKNEDMLEKLQKNPKKLDGVQVFGRHEGKEIQIDPTLIDWNTVGPAEMKRLRLWRPAGEGNPLGYYRVLMDNPYDIYLHDTNHRNLFGKQDRALSSGCVRLSNPKALVQFLIIGTPDWNMDRVAKVVSSARTLDFPLKNRIPVHIDYVTSWLDADGHLVTGVDIYDRDRHIITSMSTEGTTRQAEVDRLLSNAAAVLTASGTALPREISLNR